MFSLDIYFYLVFTKIISTFFLFFLNIENFNFNIYITTFTILF